MYAAVALPSPILILSEFIGCVVLNSLPWGRKGNIHFHDYVKLKAELNTRTLSHNPSTQETARRIRNLSLALAT